MAQQQQGQEVYDVYVMAFGKIMSGVQMASLDFRDPVTVGYTPTYKGKQLVAAALGAMHAKRTTPVLMTKSELEAAVDKCME
ncbi:hypothetical protein ACN28I_34760 [Archangium gephyra]|uniref:hypothetical protein n=1 Tax=Archangium gephyra TaxID=48 RepID=UPI003B7CA750